MKLITVSLKAGEGILAKTNKTYTGDDTETMNPWQILLDLLKYLDLCYFDC